MIHLQTETMRGDIDSDGLVQDYSNSIANALELLQSCAKPMIYTRSLHFEDETWDSVLSIKVLVPYIYSTHTWHSLGLQMT